jgi:hypothetical protein
MEDNYPLDATSWAHWQRAAWACAHAAPSNMANRDESHIPANLPSAQAREENGFTVVVNDEGQHVMWPTELALPAGWRRRPAPMPA